MTSGFMEYYCGCVVERLEVNGALIPNNDYEWQNTCMNVQLHQSLDALGRLAQEYGRLSLPVHAYQAQCKSHLSAA